MRVLLQRVANASVEINGTIESSISSGVLLLLGIESGDAIEDIQWLIKKVSYMRVFNDKVGKMNLSIKDIDGELLVISQFTLHASTKKGNRPSFIKSAKPEVAIPLYQRFIEEIKKEI